MLDRALLGKIKQDVAEEYGYKSWVDINEAYNRFFERDSLSNLVTERYSEEILKRFSKNQKSGAEESRINEHRLL